MSDETEVIWISSSKKDIKGLPEEVQDEIGYVLGLVQNGKTDKTIKPLKGLGGSVYKIKVDFDKDTYRAVYVLNLGDKIYMLHVFKKKSKKGKETPKHDIDLIRSRLKQAFKLAKELSDG